MSKRFSLYLGFAVFAMLAGLFGTHWAQQHSDYVFWSESAVFMADALCMFALACTENNAQLGTTARVLMTIGKLIAGGALLTGALHIIHRADVPGPVIGILFSAGTAFVWNALASFGSISRTNFSGQAYGPNAAAPAVAVTDTWVPNQSRNARPPSRAEARAYPAAALSPLTVAPPRQNYKPEQMLLPDPDDSEHLGSQLDPSQRHNTISALDTGLRERVVEQDEAIDKIVEIVEQYQAGLVQPNRTVGNVLFLGPTGSGKTWLVEALAEVMTGTVKAAIKIDCAEFQHSHEIAKLIGSPPGYLGHRETHPLLSADRLAQYHTPTCKLSFVLFDEIEKASDALWNLLLGILDRAQLTLGDNKATDFSNTIIFMTSNLGGRELSDDVKAFGFTQPDQAEKDVARIGTEAARSRFSPEFFNRIRTIATFKPLSQTAMNAIVLLELRTLQVMLDRRGASGFSLRCTESARAFIVKEGFDKRYGARHLARALERLVVKPLARLISSGQITPGSIVVAHLNEHGNGLVFRMKAA